MSATNQPLSTKRDQLLDLLKRLERCVVAFSGGVDSTVVAKAASLALGNAAVAVTATSASLASGELEEAERLASAIGIRHLVIKTQEFANDQYVRNAADRCYHCKTELYEQIDRLLPSLGLGVVVNGANADDRGDHRPGMIAATEHAVRSPLLECGFTKDEVRRLAAEWELPVWDKPASPCLSSRVAYGEEVTPQRLEMIDKAEQALRKLGLRELRVRYHKGDLARIEVPPEALPMLCSDGTRESVFAELKRLGFRYVTLDLEGFRSGSLNAVLPVESLKVLGPK